MLTTLVASTGLGLLTGQPLIVGYQPLVATIAKDCSLLVSLTEFLVQVAVGQQLAHPCYSTVAVIENFAIVGVLRRSLD